MPIDLRSDTVTQPSPAMRAAMAAAEVGDDVFGEDPTIARLEAKAADLAGKDAAVFVASGTMGNLTSLLAHAGRGQAAILGDESHILHSEGGGTSALGGIVFHAVPTRPDGTLPLEAIEGAIRTGGDVHATPTAVICLENTHNRCGGTVLSPQYFQAVAAVASRAGLAVHLDGARLFNAAVHSGLPIDAWTRHVTTVSLCLSKGLAAPVGSVVAGPREVVARVRKARKMVGGGMRQGGVLGAAGLVALDEMVERLSAQLGHPDRCPHGWPVDPSHEKEENKALTALGKIPVGGAATIVRLAEHDGDLLHWFYEQELVPGTRLRVLRVDPAAGLLTIEIDGRCSRS